MRVCSKKCPLHCTPLILGTPNIFQKLPQLYEIDVSTWSIFSALKKSFCPFPSLFHNQPALQLNLNYFSAKDLPFLYFLHIFWIIVAVFGNWILFYLLKLLQLWIIPSSLGALCLQLPAKFRSLNHRDLCHQRLLLHLFNLLLYKAFYVNLYNRH